MPLAFPHFLDLGTGGTDHRFSWSVTQGLRPAKFHENLRRQEAVNLRSIFAFPSSLVFKGLRCFFDPVGQLSSVGQRLKAIVVLRAMTDDQRRSSVPPLTDQNGEKTSRGRLSACITRLLAGHFESLRDYGFPLAVLPGVLNLLVGQAGGAAEQHVRADGMAEAFPSRHLGQ